MSAINDKDYYDIGNWLPSGAKDQEYLKMRKGKRTKYAPKIQSLEAYESRYIYALFDAVLDIKPNGLMTAFQSPTPIENPFWWDFVIKSKLGYISVVRGASTLEVQARLLDDTFDLDKFFIENLSKYSEQINSKLSEYSQLKTFINHYRSYQECTEALRKEIEGLDLTIPELPSAKERSGKEMHIYENRQREFIQNSIKFHALGKSLILNSAFMVEAFITLFIRFTAGNKLQEQKHLLALHLKSNFKTKLQNLSALSIVMNDDVNLSRHEVIRVLDLMTLRNKYVHNDETSALNRLNDIYFDDLFPLFDFDTNAIQDTIISTHHNPSYEKVIESHEDAKNFIEYVYSLVKAKDRPHLLRYMKQSRVVYNPQTYKYELVYPENTVMAVF